MLVTVVKRNIDNLHDAAKQVLIWAINKKQEFHDFPRNSSYSYKSKYGYGQRRKSWRYEDEDFGDKPQINVNELKTFNKDFYQPHPDVVNRSKEEIEEFYKKNDIQVFGQNKSSCPPPVFNFTELNLPEPVLSLIRRYNYTKPTPIQSQAWPLALGGKDFVGISQTGSGKTLGFALPALIHITNQPPLEHGEGPIGLVIAPTRELAQQIHSVVQPFAQSVSLRSACVFGGASKYLQREHLAGAHICIATPGRLMDFLRERTLNLSRCTYCVLDEADRLLDMGFKPQITNIMNRVRPDRQVSMWSATWPNEVKELAHDFMREYIGLKFGSFELTANPKITQHVHSCEENEKPALLRDILTEINKEPENKTLIFSKTKAGAEFIFRLLKKFGLRSEFIHGDVKQIRRDSIVRNFKRGNVNLLVGTSVVARGLDITDIRYVINYDFPVDIEEYVHVIGRTARSELPGTSHTFFTSEDMSHARDLIKILKGANQEVPEFLSRESEYRGDVRRRRYSRY